jgi:hypothetical protein
MYTPDHRPDDEIDARLEDLWCRQRVMHRMYHPDPRDPDYEYENMRGWTVGNHWLTPAPKRGGVK